jgi:hypothetical protein
MAGHIPLELRTDKIVFLYKRKGSIKDTSNYRPITHAPAWGKHLEKYILSKFTGLDDLNTENHAYTGQRSIFSAMTDLITAVQDIKRLNLDLDSTESREWEYIPIIIAEDISGAFESVPHDTIVQCIKLMFGFDKLTDNNTDIETKLPQLIKSYLDRQAYITNDKEKHKLINRPGRSTPQGSSLSPKFWRIHDHCFTTTYHQIIKHRLRQKFPEIVHYKHIAYADY